MLDDELDRKAIEIILNFRPNSSFSKNASNEILRLKENIGKILNILPENHKEIFEQRFFYNLTDEQIAEKLKRSPKEINKIIEDGIGTIKKNINKEIRPLDKGKDKQKIKIETYEQSKKEPPYKPSYENIQRKPNILITFTLVIINLILWGSILGVSYYATQKYFFKDLPTVSQLLNKTGFFGSEENLPIVAIPRNDVLQHNSNEINISGSSSLEILSKRWERSSLRAIRTP